MLTILTRTFKRPELLRVNQAALVDQTDKQFEQVLFTDDVGIGVPEANRVLRNATIAGDYVWVYDDDNVLFDDHFIANVHKAFKLAKGKGKNKRTPDWVVFDAHIGDKLLPDKWPAELAHIDWMNIVVTKAVWQKHVKDIGAAYAGDWSFIDAVMKDKDLQGVRFGIGDPIGATQRVSHGLSEVDFNSGQVGKVDGLAIKVGDKIKMKDSVGGNGFNYSTNEVVTVTQDNLHNIESFLRGGLADFDPPRFR